MHSRRIEPVLVWVAVHGEIEKVGSDAAVVKQRVALTGGAITADSFSLLLGCDEERKQFSLCLLDLFGNRSVASEAAQAEPVLQLDEIEYAPARLMKRFLVRKIDAQRPAMRGKLFDIEETKTVHPGNTVN